MAQVPDWRPPQHAGRAGLPSISEIGSGAVSVIAPRSIGSRHREDAAAEHVEVGAAEHLALEHLETYVELPFRGVFPRSVATELERCWATSWCWRSGRS